MGRGQRIGFAVIAAIIAVVAVVVLGAGGSDDETKRADTPPPTATSTPEQREEATGRSTPEATATPTPTRTPTPIETVRVRDGQVVGGLAKLRFDKGERVRFAVRSDVADHVHVHGYDIMRDVAPGGTARFSFDADIEGIFEVELEDRGVELAQLRIDP